MFCYVRVRMDLIIIVNEQPYTHCKYITMFFWILNEQTNCIFSKTFRIHNWDVRVGTVNLFEYIKINKVEKGIKLCDIFYFIIFQNKISSHFPSNSLHYACSPECFVIRFWHMYGSSDQRKVLVMENSNMIWHVKLFKSIFCFQCKPTKFWNKRNCIIKS